MKIKGLYPAGFGKLRDREYTFSDGINLITGGNEAGKTTLRQFLTAMLFGWEKGRAKADPYRRYKPWDGAGVYGGAMDIEVGGKEYRVWRDFAADEKTLSVQQYPSMREIPAPNGLLPAIGSALTRAGYENTVMVPQGSALPDEALSVLYANHIANLSASRDRGLDVAEATTALADRRKMIEKRKTADTVSALQKSIAALTKRTAELDRVAEDLAEVRAQKETNAERLRELGAQNGGAEEAAFSEWERRYDAYRGDLAEHEIACEALEAKRRTREELLADLPDVASIEERERRMDELLRAKEREDAAREAARAEVQRRETRIASRRRKLSCVWIPAAAVLVLAAAWIVYLVIAGGREGADAAKQTSLWSDWKFWLGIVAATIAATVFAGAMIVRAQLTKRYREVVAARKAAEASSDAQRELAAEIAMMPTEDSLHAERDLAVGGKARAEALAEQIAEQERELAAAAEMLAAEEAKLREDLAAFEPENEAPTLTDGTISRIRGRILARSVQDQGRRERLITESEALTTRIARLSQILEDGEGVADEMLEAERKLTEAERTLAAEKTDLAALQLAEDTIREISANIHDSFGTELNRAVSEYAAAFSGGAHGKLSVDEAFTVRTGGSAKAKESTLLSTGAVEQLALALRLASAEKMYAGEHLPLVFDDSFVYYDNVRLRSALRRLATVGEQILIFTCSDREEAILAAEGIPFAKVEM
ncbi:MAG: AAA family ATPase [Lachnospiraceae bacterium]|nr:AAA family ATPase [Lachnospiraceae bacterium]